MKKITCNIILPIYKSKIQCFLMPDDEQPKISKYNSGIAIIMRLDVLWKDTHVHSRSGQYYKWNLDLDRIWCELSRVNN